MISNKGCERFLTCWDVWRHLALTMTSIGISTSQDSHFEVVILYFPVSMVTLWWSNMACWKIMADFLGDFPAMWWNRPIWQWWASLSDGYTPVYTLLLTAQAQSFMVICNHMYIYIYMCVFLWFFEPLLVYITKAAILTNIHIYIYTYTYIVTCTNIFSQWYYIYSSITTSWSYFLWMWYNHVSMISYDYIFRRLSSHIYCTYPIWSMEYLPTCGPLLGCKCW